MFTNFFVADNEVPKEFSGCFNMTGPSPSTRGTLTGTWISEGLGPATNIIPLPHSTIKDLYIFAAHRGSMTKMVGMQYSGATPTRIGGRGFDEIVPLTSTTVSNAWNKAQYQNIDSSEYDLTMYEEAPSSTIETCKNGAITQGASVFSVSNMTKNGLVQCGAASDLGSQLSGVNEQQCLNNKKAITEYKIKSTTSSPNILGKTYGGKKDSSGKMIYQRYPESMLSMGTEYNTIPNYNSLEYTMSDGVIENVKSDDCKQYCVNRGNECKGFVFEKDSNTCNLKTTIYPAVPKSTDSNTDIYTRVPVLNNVSNGSCTTKVMPVSGELLNENGLISNDMMPTDLACPLEEDVQKEQNQMNTSYNMEVQTIKDLQTTHQRIGKEVDHVRKDISEKTQQFNKNFGKSKKYMENSTSTLQMEDAFQLQQSRYMRYIFLLFGVVGLSIVLIRVLRK